MKKILSIFLLLLCVDIGYSDSESKVKVDIDRHQFPVNENAILTITVSGSEVGEPELPQINGLSIYPSGQSQNITIINGRMQTAASYTYVLQPHAVGKILVPSIHVKQDGKDTQTDPIPLEITKTSSSIETKQEESTNSASQQTIQEKQTSRPGENISYAFCEANVDKRKAFVGEQITFIYKFYRKVNLLDQPRYTAPDFTHFWTEDLPPEKIYYEMINNERYVVSELNFALFPTTSGLLTIGPAELKCRIPVRGQSRDPFDFMDEDPFQLFNNNNPFEMFSGKETILKTKPIQIEVDDLPKQGIPEDFSGATGSSFSIKTEINKMKTKTNEPITLSIILEGDGHTQGITEPKLDFDASFKIYDSGQTNEIKKDQGILHGKKIFKKLIIPLREGNFQIPSIHFSFFNLQKKSYETIQSEPIQITVEKGKEEYQPPSSSDSKPPKGAIELLNKDIEFIKTHNTGLSHLNNHLQMNIMLLSLLFPSFLFLFSGAYTLRRISFERNSGSILVRNAYKKSVSKLRKLHSHLKNISQKDFYGELEKTFQEYFITKLDIDLKSDPSREIEKTLQEKGLDGDSLSVLRKILEDLHLARFAPVETNFHERQEILKRIIDFLKMLEKKL